MSLITILLVLLLIGTLGGGYYAGPTYYNHFGIGTLLIVVLLFLALTGRI